jgi:gas vesicle protein
VKNEHDDEESTESDSSQENEEASGIDMTCGDTVVSWKNADGQIRRTGGLYLDLFMDISTTNTAIFKLYGYILLKANKGKSNKQAVYLFIYPESIRSITLETIHDAPSQLSTNLGFSHQSLSFSLAAQPHLVVPQDLILESRMKTAALLDSIQALATTVDFTVSFGNTDTVASTLHNLRLVASVFSSTFSGSRPSTNARRANLNALYAGKGGEVVHTNDVTASAAVQPPPLYSEAMPGPSNKRKRVNSDIDDDRSPGVNNQILLLLKNICARLDTIDDRMGRLEDKVTEAIDTDRTSCRYGTEERTEIIEVVDNRIDDCITDLKVESHDILQELKEEVDDTLERLDNEASDKMDQLENEIDENTTKLVKQYLKEKLSNASLRVDGTVFLDI